MMEMTDSDYCIELEILLDFFEDFIMKFCKSYYISRKQPANIRFTVDEHYTRWISDRLTMNPQLRLHQEVVNRCDVDFMDEERDRIKDKMAKLKPFLDDDLRSSTTKNRISRLLKRGEKLLTKYEERRFFVLTYWNNQKNRSENNA